MPKNNSAIVVSTLILICSPFVAGATSLPLVDDARFEETTKANLARLNEACQRLLKALPEVDAQCRYAGHARSQINGMKGICENAPKLLRQTADEAKKARSEAGALEEAKAKAEAELKPVDSQIEYFATSSSGRSVLGMLERDCPTVGSKLVAAKNEIVIPSVGRAFRDQVSALHGYYSHRQNP